MEKTSTVFVRKNHNFLREIVDFTKEVTKESISRKFLIVIAFYSTFPHCVFAKLYSYVKSTGKFFIRTKVDFTKFLRQNRVVVIHIQCLTSSTANFTKEKFI